MKALVVGGTGPTGPYVVNGLLKRGYQVTILHGGFHEVEFDQPVEHIHSDPHFKETLEASLGKRTWDLIIFTYGRLRLGVEAAKGRCARFIAVGGFRGGLVSPNDPRWGVMGQHLNVTEEEAIMETDINQNKFSYLLAISQEAVLEAHRQGHYVATYLGYPVLYGPRAPGPHEWSIVRRILDGRKHFIIADGGIKIGSRAYAENAAHALLLCVDNPQVAGGKKYVMTDQKFYTMRQRIEFIARYMNHKWELVDMPWDLATPCHVFWGHQRDHYARDSHKIQKELGYRDIVPTEEALKRTVDWLMEHRLQPGGEEEIQLGDSFDYAKEDELIKAWKETLVKMPRVAYLQLPHAHVYRHPAYPGEPWKLPEPGGGQREEDS